MKQKYTANYNNYVSLCLEDISESAYGIDEMDRVAKLGYSKEGTAWGDYHKEILFRNILDLFFHFDLTIEDLEKYNKKEKIL